MGEKAKELDNKHQGDRGACPICSPRSNRITESRLWAWAMRQPEPVNPLR